MSMVVNYDEASSKFKLEEIWLFQGLAHGVGGGVLGGLVRLLVLRAGDPGQLDRLKVLDKIMHDRHHVH